MKIKYYKEDDIVVVRFSEKPVDDSFEVENAILEVDKDKAPVALEILNASKFLNLASKNLRKKLHNLPDPTNPPLGYVGCDE